MHYKYMVWSMAQGSQTSSDQPTHVIELHMLLHVLRENLHYFKQVYAAKTQIDLRVKERFKTSMKAVAF